MRQLDEKEKYLDIVCAQVNWKHAHGVIRKELGDHIEDQAAAYAAEGVPEQETIHRAICSMGDPEEVGMAYAACFRPKRQWGMVCLIVLTVLLGIGIRLAMGGIFGWRSVAALVFGCGCTALFCCLNLYDLAQRAWFARALFVGFLLAVALELGGTYVRHAAAFLPLLFAGAVYSLRGKGLPALIACAAALTAVTWVLMARWSMRNYLYAVGILTGCLFAAVLAALAGVFGRRRFLAAGVFICCAAVSVAAVVFLNAYRMQEFMKILLPVEEQAMLSLTPGLCTVHDVVNGARMIGRGTVAAIADAQGTAPGNGSDLSLNSYLLTQVLYRWGWLAAAAASAVPLGFVSLALVRALRLKSLLGRMLAGAVSAFFAAQTLIYCAANFGLLGGLPLSLPLLAGGELALALNFAMAGALIALFRMDGLHADRIPKLSKRLRVRLEWA